MPFVSFARSFRVTMCICVAVLCVADHDLSLPLLFTNQSDLFM
jgi:hypothetical protein